MSHNAWLLLDTALAVAALVLLVAWLKLNSFVALTVVSLAAGLAAGMEPSKVAGSFADGVGGVLGKIAVVIGLGAILGQMLAESGGADQIATALVRGFGGRRMALAFVAAGFLIGLPVFFQVGLVLLIPIAEVSAEKMGVALSRFGLPLVAGLSASHALIPPHPGPLAAVTALHADIGKTILFGLLVGARRRFSPGWSLDAPAGIWQRMTNRDSSRPESRRPKAPLAFGWRCSSSCCRWG